MGQAEDRSSPRSVLVVHGELHMRETLYDALTRRGYVVMTASSGRQALELLKGKRVTLILLDTTLKEPPSLEVARQIRALDGSAMIVLLQGTVEYPLPAAELEQVRISDVLQEAGSVDYVLGRLEQLLGTDVKQQTSERVATPRRATSGKLLIAEDDAQIRKLLKVFFETQGFSVVAVDSGEATLRALKESPDLILLDINMPGMDGIMTLKKIRDSHPQVPVIMVSGIGEESIAREALKAGAYDYVAKPFNLDHLNAVVSTRIQLGV